LEEKIDGIKALNLIVGVQEGGKNIVHMVGGGGKNMIVRKRTAGKGRMGVGGGTLTRGRSHLV